MNAPDLVVRCMAWKENGLWVAACIDLTLATQAETLSEARRKLNQQITAYVNEAITIDAEHAEALLSRRAPLMDQMRFAFWSAVAKRPRIRAKVGALVARVGLEMVKKVAYQQPLPIALAG